MRGLNSPRASLSSPAFSPSSPPRSTSTVSAVTSKMQHHQHHCQRYKYSRVTFPHLDRALTKLPRAWSAVQTHAHPGSLSQMIPTYAIPSHRSLAHAQVSIGNTPQWTCRTRRGVGCNPWCLFKRGGAEGVECVSFMLFEVERTSSSRSNFVTPTADAGAEFQPRDAQHRAQSLRVTR